MTQQEVTDRILAASGESRGDQLRLDKKRRRLYDVTIVLRSVGILEPHNRKEPKVLRLKACYRPKPQAWLSPAAMMPWGSGPQCHATRTAVTATMLQPPPGLSMLATTCTGRVNRAGMLQTTRGIHGQATVSRAQAVFYPHTPLQSADSCAVDNASRIGRLPHEVFLPPPTSRCLPGPVEQRTMKVTITFLRGVKGPRAVEIVVEPTVREGSPSMPR